jgi:23S rRNA pseudouridine1911/1915/1917 synthase
VDESLFIGQLSNAREAILPQQWEVTASNVDFRLDTFLHTCLPSVAKREIIEWIAAGRVRINTKPGKKGDRLHRGDQVSLLALTSLLANPQLTVRVLFADEALLILDKPAGIPSIALRRDETNTVPNFLLAHFPETATAGPRPLEAGVVHRLDTSTSGILIVARTPFAYAALRNEFQSHTVEKCYLALVEGQLRSKGERRSWLTPEGKRGQRMREGATGEGQRACTIYSPIESFPRHTFLRVTIPTGVRHQIRVQLAALGHPIIGDVLYGSTEHSTRLCLHATALTFTHPLTGKRLRFQSPLPEDFRAIQKRVIASS